MSKSQHYNHPYWPSPRAARFARLLLKQNTLLPKPEGRMTHDKALTLMADYLILSVHEFLHVKPLEALQLLKLAMNEKEARAIIGSDYRRRRWSRRYFFGKPCCVCDRILDPVPEPEEPEVP